MFWLRMQELVETKICALRPPNGTTFWLRYGTVCCGFFICIHLMLCGSPYVIRLVQVSQTCGDMCKDHFLCPLKLPNMFPYLKVLKKQNRDGKLNHVPKNRIYFDHVRFWSYLCFMMLTLFMNSASKTELSTK